MTTTTRASIQATRNGYSVEFDGYYVSISCRKNDNYTASQAYAECITIANAVDVASNLDYAAITAWAEATVKMNRAVLGDCFATAEETAFILSDIWGNYHNWIGEFNHAFGRGIIDYSLWPDHRNETVRADIDVHHERIGRADHNVYVNRDDHGIIREV